MYKKQLISIVFAASLLFANSGVAYAAAGPGFLGSLWSSFSGAVSIVIKTIYAPFNSPPPIVKPANPEVTLSGAIKSGATPGPLYIPGKVGFGGTGGVIPSTLFPIPKNDKSADVSNIGNIAPSSKSLFNTDIKVPAGKGVPYVTPQPPTPYPKPIISDQNFKSLLGAPTTVSNQKTLDASIPVKATGLIIATTGDLSAGLTEGDKRVFTANIRFNNGALKDVSKLVSWSVVGDIGSVTSQGIFTAELGQNASEYGKGTGSVIASYGGPEGYFLGKSAYFKVIGAVGTDTNIGGQ